ncbi:hypothetical protein VM57_09360 [Stenotrophomonas maltophilia]|uniref:DUF7844 domain-containing protein n=1 Tax=Stenotrophomonas maltophilia TaxID=40324 RepID=A0A0F5ZNW3_STEMA|nr:hypothetical protein VM57_09360 [Stenotrophomonas maltophilia]
MTSARNAARHGLALLLAVPAAHASSDLRLDPEGLSPAQQQVAMQTLADVQSLLPDGLLRSLPAHVQVRWSDHLPADVHGRASPAASTCVASCWMMPCPAHAVHDAGRWCMN